MYIYTSSLCKSYNLANCKIIENMPVNKLRLFKFRKGFQSMWIGCLRKTAEISSHSEADPNIKYSHLSYDVM